MKPHKFSIQTTKSEEKRESYLKQQWEWKMSSSTWYILQSHSCYYLTVLSSFIGKMRGRGGISFV